MYGTTNRINSNFKMNNPKYLNGKHYILLTGNDLKCFNDEKVNLIQKQY